MDVCFDSENAVSGEASTIGKGKGRSLPVGLFTFQVPSKTSNSITSNDSSTSSTSISSSCVSSSQPHTIDNSEPAGNTTPKIKPRRVSTSALPTESVGEPSSSSNWAFRDEMGISHQRPVATTSTSASRLPSAESALSSSRKGRPRKAMSMSMTSTDTSDLGASSNTPDAPMDPAPKRARRNMWTEEETMHLVEGCKAVSYSVVNEPRSPQRLVSLTPNV